MIDPITAALGFFVGVSIALIGGFLLGRNYERQHASITRDSDSRLTDAEPDSPKMMTQSPASFADSLPGSGIIVAAEIDAASQWRRTHGQSTLDALTAELRRLIGDTAAGAVFDDASSDIVVAWLPQTEQDDAPAERTFDVARRDTESLVAAAKSHEFRLPSGETPFVSASFGAAQLHANGGPVEQDAVVEATRHAVAGVGESRRIGRNKLHIWDGRRLRRTD